MLDGSNLLLRGIALISLGAFIDGSLGLALKYLKRWKWEHLWLVYSVLAFSVIPWILGFGTIKDLPAFCGWPTVVTCFWYLFSG